MAKATKTTIPPVPVKPTVVKTSSAKAKGRRLQQRVRDDMRAIAGSRLDPTDIESTTMGLSGVDIILTKAAKDLFGPLAFECKNVEKLNAVGVFSEQYTEGRLRAIYFTR